MVDASAVVELLLGTPRAVRIAARLAAPSESIHAPHLLDLEVASVLRTLEQRGQITPSDAAMAISDLLRLSIIRYPHDPMLPRIWQLRGNLTPYDAAYVVLAEHLSAPVATCDARLARTPGMAVPFELF